MNISEQIKNKIRSESGASLLVALLFFVMCAVVGSVVLVAATASAGRAKTSGASSDRQRYALESAANLIKEALREDSTSSSSGSGNAGNSADASNDSDLVLTQSWNYREVLVDAVAVGTDSYEAGERTHTSGYYVLGLDATAYAGGTGSGETTDPGNGGSYGLTNQSWVNSTLYGTYMNVNTSTHASSQKQPFGANSGAADATALRDMRDVMAEAVYRHYWNEIAAIDEDSNGVVNGSATDIDPWNGGQPSAISNWRLITEQESTEFQISTDSANPMKIALQSYGTDSSDQMYTVYADVVMDQDFRLTFTLFCTENNQTLKTDRSNADQTMLLVFEPENTLVTYENETTEVATESLTPIQITEYFPGNVNVNQLNDATGDTGSSSDGVNVTYTSTTYYPTTDETVAICQVSRNRHTYLTERSVTLSVSWSEGKMTAQTE